MNVVNVLLRIESSLYELPKSERKVAQYILDHPEQVVRMTIHELAAQADASSSAVTRLCRSIEIGSFAELKVSLSSHISTDKKTGFYDIEPNETIDSIKDKIVSNSIQVIQETALNLQEKTVLELIKTIKEAQVIYVYGVGASWLVAEDISHKWLRVGKVISAHQDSHITATALASSNKNALFFCVSNSGETREVLQLVDIAKESGITTVGLSRFGHNTLSNKVDISLHHVRAPEAKNRSAATTSLIAQFLTIDILFYAYVSNYFEDTIEEIHQSRDAVAKLTEKHKK
ncbi:RpiR family transcriptional regulator [Priestia aryabhattai]|uniref:MurR/RpiR family transcriptional regulator n=1 Tax=Bacillaceae TaxID=186817 RepID=UPI000BA124C1|nr:MurR/RpiR family transcriptional regulator [Bacillus sp. CBEL-1]OZT13680.1 RpiR family transcriptional regulator [Priestia aryabhattai]TDB49728.1 MurR/RpiR family transcriptional regulator [Bacillus sp. CBEL-1]